MPETGALYETLTAGEYLTMVANLRGIDGRHAENRVSELLDLFGIPDARGLLSALEDGPEPPRTPAAPVQTPTPTPADPAPTSLPTPADPAPTSIPTAADDES